MRPSLSGWLQQTWYRQGDPPAALLPLEALFRRAVLLRRSAYLHGRKTVERLPVPVIVVGNLSVGGTGKTPLTIWLADYLKASGYRPGIVSRGYGGQPQRQPLMVSPTTHPQLAGDEPVLIARRTGCPVCVFPKRVEAGQTLLAETDCNLIIADDGLQHYALGRDIEIAVIDGARGFGNGHCLPAGPLRESAERLQTVDQIVYSGTGPTGSTVMTLNGNMAVNLLDVRQRQPLNHFTRSPACALAGIGNPDRFFDHLRQQGLTLAEARGFPDHHHYRSEDLAFAGTTTTLMTEKDAVKCSSFATANLWQVPVDAILPATFGDQLNNLLKTKY